MPYRKYRELLEQVPNVITYEQTGRVEGATAQEDKDREALKQFKKEGLL